MILLDLLIMENQEPSQQEIVNQVYNHAADLIVNQGKSSQQAIDHLVEQGLDQESASAVVNNIQDEITKAKKDRAGKDMLYGALWAIGGTVATIADIGYIFWGAIVFGAIQFFKGVINSTS